VIQKLSSQVHQQISAGLDEEVYIKMEENLSWILDDKKDTYTYEEEVPDQSISRSEWLDRKQNKFQEKIKQNIEFVHSLGL